MKFTIILSFVFLAYGANSARVNDLITSLPGLKQQLQFKQYSGYLDVSSTKHLHYWFVESQNNPATDPVVLWLNGGPGCSSLDGLLSENGPLHVNDDGETLYMNPYSWNKLANVIYLESPAGVGYSYDDNDDVTTSDKDVAKYNYAALVEFFKGFPEYSKNPFYITGESYGGIYIPTLAMQIIESGGSINLKGFAVGNGLSSYDSLDNSLVYFAYYHGLVGEVLWKALLENCCNGGFTRHNCSFSIPRNSMCSDSVEEVFQLVYRSGLNEYALYRDCAGLQAAKSYDFAMKNVFRNLREEIREEIFSKKWNEPVQMNANGVKEVPPCINSTAQTNWLNRQDVRKSLHISPHIPKWDICSVNVESGYNRDYQTMKPQYEKILQQGGLRILIYNGDTDMACNFLSDQWFFEDLNLQPVRSHAPWYVKGQVAGFARTFKQLSFTTIRGAGHMVPQWRPEYAYAMIEKFINDEPFNQDEHMPR